MIQAAHNLVDYFFFFGFLASRFGAFLFAIPLVYSIYAIVQPHYIPGYGLCQWASLATHGGDVG